MGIQHNDFQQSTIGISTNANAWFLRHVRQRQEEQGISRALGTGAFSAAAASAGRQRGQKSSTTTQCDSRLLSAGHAGTSSAACCPRCPRQVEGGAVMHATGTLICEVPCVCGVCGSDRHLDHGCFMAHGVPVRVNSEDAGGEGDKSVPAAFLNSTPYRLRYREL